MGLLDKLREIKKANKRHQLEKYGAYFCTKIFSVKIIYSPALLFACTRTAIHKLIGLFQRESDICKPSAIKYLESLARHVKF